MTHRDDHHDTSLEELLEESVTATGAAARRPETQPTSVVALDGVPSPRSVQLTALGRTAQAVVSSPSVSTTLPDVALRAGLTLDRERLDAYCHLLGERALETAPPGFVHVSVFGLQLALMARADFPLPMLGLVHIANRIEQLRPVRTDEPLTATTWARRLASREVGEGMGTQVELVTEIRSGVELVWQGVSTYLARSTQITGLPAHQRPEHPTFEAPTPTGGWETSLRSSKLYAEVSGDRNPIHTSKLAARAFGYRATIAHGMDTAARALAALGPARGDAFTWSVEFAAPVLVPGRVAVGVERRDDVDSSDGGSRAGYALTVWDPRRGKLHLTSTLAQA
ncbi:hypothetical protein C8046_14780 [Serinibacter arcticus]|uniref:MaoC-like domain-containing protein n=1 Tax=Serinibacter arcticus TaxID=1655435 RepID=A0A2U1ZXK9_9MICO|nr:MaoC/PaaZ C-terminal domain-containing protein [Serinibacter arcticus]PWD51725.1 hypothetical protein C8046_14780 [Serinibacter arcticus]